MLDLKQGGENFLMIPDIAKYAATILMTSTYEIVRNGGGRGQRGEGRKRKTKGKDKSKPPTEPAESDKGRAPRHLSDLSDLRK